ncbi:MAG: lytic murein transglycosylase B [Xanthomonadales bacterium]|nr:lytic murein transglycosylase B [Gammaproteobacteria bacterium]NNK37877.1 lytic murein transglycosylase B [Xanthomonadales bacterium]
MPVASLRGSLLNIKRIMALALVSVLSASCLAQQHPGAADFAAKAETEHGLNPAEVEALLQDARFKQSIVDAISRPAESKPWYDYRPIFITDKRIDGGVAFWRENRALIEQASEQFGVDPQIIVAIIGVETLYGRITGSYRVLDALTTLSFYYPDTGNDRSGFFSRELMHFLLLGKEEGLPLRDVTGSYAGAMGLGQFMPSSYREYAVDLDGDGRRDLWSSLPDVIGSVANYLHRHGWQPGEAVTVPAEIGNAANREQISRRNFKPEKTVADLAAAGITPLEPFAPETQAAVVRLEEKDGDAFWMTFQNFYVITRYNRSPLYAMAVFELSEAIRAGIEE